MKNQLSAKTLFSRPMNQREATFLNQKGGNQKLQVACANKLGVLGRVALVFSRRGFSVSRLNFQLDNDKRFSVIDIEFVATDEQTRDVVKSLNNLIDTVEVRLIEKNTPTLYQEHQQTGEINVF